MLHALRSVSQARSRTVAATGLAASSVRALHSLAASSTVARAAPRLPSPCCPCARFSSSAPPISGGVGSGVDVIYTQKIPKKKSSFRDRVRIHVSGGRGGSGCSSYDTDPYGKGGPDGANGGRGGDVYLVSTSQLSSFTLESFHLRAHNGHAGGSQLSKGRNGFSLKVPIPAGSIVSEILSTDPEQGQYTLKFLADMDRTGLEIKVASGGAGGLGNRAFKTKYRKQARFSTLGNYGSQRWLHLELKCIADVGLVGYPKSIEHAGKSSFLAAISNATPEIANYPFTTLHPQVGVVEEGAGAGVGVGEEAAGDGAATAPALGRRMSVADLPGLISGAASANKGLGHEFLKHIQRTKVLAYVLDISGNDARDPVQDFLSLQQELATFDSELLRKPAIILANKTDNVRGLGASKGTMSKRIEQLRAVTTLPILSVSCLKRQGLVAAVSELFALVADAEAKQKEEVRVRMSGEVESERAVREETQRQQEEEAAEAARQKEEEEAARAAAEAAEPEPEPTPKRKSKTKSSKTEADAKPPKIVGGRKAKRAAAAAAAAKESD